MKESIGGGIFILDIGSCFDPWRPLETRGGCAVTALDLAPAAPTVYKCDFLTLDVGAPGTALEASTPGGPGDGAGMLTRLPAGHFHVAVLSLVLSYIPDAMQRTAVVAKARRLLAGPPNGSGVLFIVTPISTDASFTPQRALPVLHEWREAIEALGFQRHAIKRLRTIHVMAYRTVGVSGEALPLKPMRIAYDARVADSDREPLRGTDARERHDRRVGDDE
jgi:hypothetical protein